MTKLGFLFLAFGTFFCSIQSILSMEIILSKDALGEKLVLQALQGSLDDVRALVEENKDLIDYHAKIDGFTPLIAAVWGQQIAVVVYLLNQHVDVNACDLKKRTALHYVASKGFWEIVGRLFTRADILVNEKDARGDTPAHCAAKADQQVCAQLIMTHQGFKNKSDACGKKFYNCFSSPELRANSKSLYNQILRHH